MNPKRSNSGFFVILLILVMAAYYFISVFQPGSGDYSYQQLMRDVKANHVTAITIKQNKEVPTGTVTAELGKDNYKSCEVTDVNETIKDIKASNKSLGNKIEIKGIDHSGDMISTAEQYIGQPLDALEGACGSPQGSSYEDDPETGKTGFHYYSNFTVSTTVDENGNEIVAGIW